MICRKVDHPEQEHELYLTIIHACILKVIDFVCLLILNKTPNDVDVHNYSIGHFIILKTMIKTHTVYSKL